VAVAAVEQPLAVMEELLHSAPTVARLFLLLVVELAVVQHLELLAALVVQAVDLV
jgi:hypothetical protein